MTAWLFIQEFLHFNLKPRDPANVHKTTSMWDSHKYNFQRTAKCLLAHEEIHLVRADTSQFYLSSENYLLILS